MLWETSDTAEVLGCLERRLHVYIDPIWGAVLTFYSKHSHLYSKEFITKMKIFLEEMLAGRRTTLVAGII